MGGFAWVTLATNDSYSLGALVLAHSLRRVNTAHQLVVLITPGVTEAMKTQLSAVFNVVKLVDVLDSQDAENLALLARPELGITFTKLHCWRLTQFDKCVFLDADTLVLQNSDELFEREELSAAPDAGWPDCFNSGVFVYKPSDETYKALIEFALIHGSFDGGDQGLLNLFFSDWPTKDIKKHLPFVYNMCSTATYSYLPAFKQFGQGLKIVHFIGTAKPWLQPFNTETGLASVSGQSQNIYHFVQLWWDLFCTNVHPSLSSEMAGLAAALASVTLGAPLSAEQTALEEHLRRQGWEQGNIDYMGKDSFSNIWQKICDTLSSSSQRIPVEEAPAPVAPVAAPVYVSSVEISPTGPIDTSPPASYAPVSAPKPTVVASDTELATKAIPVEAVTVVPDPESPSVTELISTEPSVASASIETPAQPSTPVPEVSKEISATTAPQPETPTLLQETAVKTETSPASIDSAPLLQTEIPPVSPAPVETVVTTSSAPAPTEAILAEPPASVPPVNEVQIPITSVKDSAPVLTETSTPLKETTVTAPVLSEVIVPTSPPATVEVPVPVSVEVPVPATEVPVPAVEVASPIPLAPTSPETSEVVTPVLAETPVLSGTDTTVSPAASDTQTPPVEPLPAIIPTPSEVLVSVPPVATEILAPPGTLPTEISAPVSITAKTTVPTSPEQAVTAVPESITPISTAKSTEPPVDNLKTQLDNEKLTGPKPTVPITPKQPVTEPTPPTSPSKDPTPVKPDTVAVTKSSAVPLDTSLVQPDTPTVTEPTPPTSPPTVPVESPLTSKLKVETEQPATPPVGSSEQPSLVAGSEPPVPPKRKGGSKSTQDGKNQKGGKQSKGKK